MCKLYIYLHCLLYIFIYKYRFTLSGSLYRKELVQIIIKIIGFIFGKNSLIYRKFQQFIEQQTNTETRAMNRVATTVH